MRGGGHADGHAPAIFFDAPRWPAARRCCRSTRHSIASWRQDAFLARFAAAADQFQEPGNWFTRLKGRRNEQRWTSRSSHFPIVHGVRALALQYGVREQGTAARLARWCSWAASNPTWRRTGAGAAPADGIRSRTSSASASMGSCRQRGQAVELSTLEREPLHDAWHLKRFRLFCPALPLRHL